MSKKLTTEEFIERAKAIHGDKYDYSLVEYKTDKNKVKIICKHCRRIFEQKPSNHLQGKGCLNCGQLKSHQKRLKTTKEFIKEAKKIYGNKYDYSEFEYKGAKVKGKIWCNTCREFFYTTPSNFLRGRKCPKCAFKQRVDKRSSTTEEFIKNAKKIHDDKYNYSKVNYINSYTKVSIECNCCHKVFKQQPHKHLIGQGCPFCHDYNSSKEEKYIFNLLQKRFNLLKTQYKSKQYPWKCDFYIPEINTYIEYQGYWGHGKLGTKVLGPYNVNNEEHQKVLNTWKQRSIKHSTYKRAIEIWTVRDPLKRKTAKDNGLNWLEFFTIEEFMKWYNKN